MLEEKLGDGSLASSIRVVQGLYKSLKAPTFRNPNLLYKADKKLSIAMTDTLTYGWTTKWLTETASIKKKKKKQ